MPCELKFLLGHRVFLFEASEVIPCILFTFLVGVIKYPDRRQLNGKVRVQSVLAGMSQ